MQDRATERGRINRSGLLLSASAAVVMISIAAPAQADCAAEIHVLERQIKTAEAARQASPDEGGRMTGEQREAQAAAPQPEAGATPSAAEPDQGQTVMVVPAEPEDARGAERQDAATRPGMEGIAPAQDEGAVRQQGMVSPDQMQSVRPPAGASIAGPGEAPSAGQQQPQVRLGQMSSVGQVQRSAVASPSGASNPVIGAEQAPPEVSVSHPMILLLADGTIVDMRPPEEAAAKPDQPTQQAAAEQQQPAQPPAQAAPSEASGAAPQAPEQAAAGSAQDATEVRSAQMMAEPEESWFDDQPTFATVQARLEDARAALQKGDEQQCLELVQEARARIDEYNLAEPAGSGQSQPQ